MKDRFFKAVIINLETKTSIPIVCKIYNFNNLYFAEEIITGAIFPIVNSKSLYTIDNSYIPIRENYIDGLSLVLPKCIKQDQTRNFDGQDIYNINTHKYEKERYKKYTELTRNLDNFNIDEVRKGNETIFLNTSLFDQNKYISEISNDYEYTTSILEAKINNDKIFETIGYYIKKARIGNHNATVISSSISNSNKTNADGSCYIPLNLSTIAKYGFDLSKKEEFIDLIDRDNEIKRIIKNICIKNTSVLLVGQSGSGKTAIIEEIARLTKTDNNFLRGKIIFSLNTNSLVSGTKYRGDFEEKLEKVIKFCKEHNKQIILFIDEMHNLKGLGSTPEMPNDAINILKPYLSDGSITIIGATTKNEYEKYLTEDEAFLRRFEKINIDALEKETIVNILLIFNKKLEKKYNIKFNIDEDKLKELFNLIVELTDTKHQRIVGDIVITNPTLCKYLLEDAYAECIYESKEEVTIEELAKAIRNCDKVSPTKKEELADLILDEYKESSFKDDKTIKKDNEIIKLSFN